jgi:hypothetical protein
MHNQAVKMILVCIKHDELFSCFSFFLLQSIFIIEINNVGRGKRILDMVGKNHYVYCEEKSDFCFLLLRKGLFLKGV